MLGLKLNKFDYFYTPEVVGRGCETQLQVGENLNCQCSAFIKYQRVNKQN